MATQDVIESTTQKYLDIHDITNDILVLKDGSTAVILTVNAMNFGLLAEPEQDAIMYAYAGLLNSINYPIEIVIRSQTKDVTKYLGLLKEEEEKSTSDIKRNWISRYREFVADLIRERNVLDKKFYVVIPASSLEMGLLPPSTVIPGVKQPDLSSIERSVILERAREILEPKRDHLLAQLARIGLSGRQLETQEIIQLFYLSYNPEAAEGQQITDTRSYTTALVEASIQGGNMADQPSSPSSNQQPPAGGNAPAGGTPAAAGGAKPPAGGTPTGGAPVVGGQAPTGSPSSGPAPTPGSSNAPKPAGAPAAGGNVPTSGAAPSPAGGAPAAGGNAGAASPAPGTPDAQAQDVINSSLKQMGSTGSTAAGGAPSAATPSPAGGAKPPAGGTPAPGAGAAGSAGTTPSPAGGAPAAGANAPAGGAKDQKDLDPDKPLPEI